MELDQRKRGAFDVFRSDITSQVMMPRIILASQAHNDPKANDTQPQITASIADEGM